MKKNREKIIGKIEKESMVWKAKKMRRRRCRKNKKKKKKKKKRRRKREANTCNR